MQFRFTLPVKSTVSVLTKHGKFSMSAGINIVDDARWVQFKDDPSIKKRIDDGHIVLLGAKTPKINVNTATKPELVELPAVGSATADRLIAERPFKTLDGVQAAAKLSDKDWDNLAPLITV